MNLESSKRLVSLDIFRGATIGAMIIVNNMRVWSDTPRFPQLVHSAWNGCTLADLIFPFFLFIVGVSTVFSLDRRVQSGESPLQLYRHILTRSTILFLLGLLACSWFIFGWLFQAICPPEATQKSMWAILLSPPDNAEVWFFSLANLRIPGVLQRIALVYLAVALLVIQTRSRWGLQAIIAGALLLLYWGLMSLPGFKLLPGEDLGAYLDRAVFGEAHLWRFTRTWDPEGLLSTLPAIATGLAGALTGYWLRSKKDGHTKLLGLLAAGCLGIAVGAAWGRVFPLNKYLWTSSYVVYSAGFALVALGACYWLFDLQAWRLFLIQPFVWLGMNPLFAYVGAQIGAVALGTLYIGTVPHHTHLGPLIQDLLFGRHWDALGETRWHDPSWPMLYWALLYLTFWTLLTGLLYRKRIFFRV
jgi:predicted acyltransferase